MPQCPKCGQPAANGQPREVRFRHGIPTAQSFWSADLQIYTRRLSLEGEFVLNPQDFKFPTSVGSRNRETAKAGYVTGQVRMGHLEQRGADAPVAVQ